MNITKSRNVDTRISREMRLRIMCPEYSVDKIDIKSFPHKEGGDIFALCWNVEESGTLYAAYKPISKAVTIETTFQSGRKTQYHTHDYIELAYIVEGEFMQRIMGQDVLFKKGELCLIDKNCPHQDFLLNQNSIVLFVGLANEFFDEVMVENIGEEKLLNFLRVALMKQKDIRQYLHFTGKGPEGQHLEELLLRLLLEMEQSDTAVKYISKGLIIRILNYISTYYDFELSNEQKKKRNWLIYEEMIRYIEENYSWITIKDLVLRFHFNEDYYNRILKKRTGMTYLKYVQEIRLKNAYRLIKTTDSTVDEIASIVGYQNKGYFYKIFINKYGITPAKLRKHGMQN